MIWVLLSAGRGPGECKIAAKGLLRELLAEASGVKVEAAVIDLEEASYGLMSALVSLEEDDADALARSWGTREVGVPKPLQARMGPQELVHRRFPAFTAALPSLARG